MYHATWHRTQFCYSLSVDHAMRWWLVGCKGAVPVTYLLLVIGWAEINLLNTIAELTLFLISWNTDWKVNVQHSLSNCYGTSYANNWCLAKINPATLTFCKILVEAWNVIKWCVKSMTNSLLAMKWDSMDCFACKVQFHSLPVAHAIRWNVISKWCITHILFVVMG